MIFGDGFAVPQDAAGHDWLVGTVDLRSWTVGGLLPDHLNHRVALDAVDPDVDDWGREQQARLATLADLLVGHTDSPASVRFAVWDGHGFGNQRSFVAWDPANPPTPEARAQTERELLAADLAREREVAAGLAALPRLDLPWRTYYVVEGAVTDVARLRWPGDPTQWLRPDLWWPDDRAWFVATDVDFWRTYVGGSAALVEEVLQRFGAAAWRVAPEDELPIEA